MNDKNNNSNVTHGIDRRPSRTHERTKGKKADIQKRFAFAFASVLVLICFAFAIFDPSCRPAFIDLAKYIVVSLLARI